MVERKRNGYSDREIMRLSGHKRITSLEHYDPGKDTDSCLNSGEENCVDPLSINTESCLNNEDENKQLSQVMIEYEDNEIICAELNKPIENIAASNGQQQFELKRTISQKTKTRSGTAEIEYNRSSK